MRQAGVVIAGPSQELGAQGVVYPPSVGHWSQGRVTHRPQARVLTLQRETERKNLNDLFFLSILEVL